jgi:hypothetical protein
MTANSATEDLIILSDGDNVGIARRTIDAGQSIRINGSVAQTKESIYIGHKIALRKIKKHEPIVRFKMIVGTATQDIPRGTHVHLHNMASNYISPTLIPSVPTEDL